MSVESLKAQGNEAFKLSKFKEAVKYFSQAIDLDSSNAVLYSNRSGAYVSDGDYQKALEDSERCIRLKPDWAKGYSRKGAAEFQLKKYKEAIASYTQGLKLDPNNQALLSGLHQAQAMETNFSPEKEVDLMIYGLLLNPKFKKYADDDKDFTQKLKSILVESMKDPKNLQLAIALNPDPRITEALKLLLRIQPSPEDVEEKHEEERRKEAKKKERQQAEKKKASEKPKTLEETEADEWKDKGNKLYSQRNFEEAIEAYDKAIEVYPSNITYQINKAAVYLEMGDYDKCLSECQACLDKRYEVRAEFEKVAKIYARMGTCYKRMKDYDNAIAMYEKALTEDNSRQYRAALSDLKALREKKLQEDYINPELAEKHRLQGNEFFKKGDLPAAKHEYDEAIRRNPSDPKIYANRCATLMKLLELPMALQDADKSLDLDPSVPKVWARKGIIHMMMKEYNKAMNSFQKGLNVDPQNYDCAKGLQDVTKKIQESMSSDEVDEEQIKHAMADPEIQALLVDPQMSIVLRNISENPAKLNDALKDPRIAMGIQKLIAAGILRTSA